MEAIKTSVSKLGTGKTSEKKGRGRPKKN